MAANNQGIAHFLNGTRVACKRDDAHIAVKFEAFPAETRQCKRCAAIYVKVQALKAKLEARGAA